MTGDIGEETEKKLLELGLLEDVDFLKVGHHGSDVYKRQVWNTGVLAIIIPAFLWILSASNYGRCCVTKKSEKLAK